MLLINTLSLMPYFTGISMTAIQVNGLPWRVLSELTLTQPHSMLLSCLHDMQRHPLPTLIISCTNRNRKKSHSRISSRRLHCFFATKVLCSICSCIIYTLPPALSDLPVLPFWSAQRPLSRRWMLLGGRRTAGH